MDAQELSQKVRNYETLASRAESLRLDERAALRSEVRELYDSLAPSALMKKYGAGGALAGAVLPVIGLFSGGAVGAVVGAVRANQPHFLDARNRLEKLLDRLA